MHVLQRIAIQADSKQEAFDEVKSRLEKEMGGEDYATNTWYDWFVTGGGRWNPNENSQYNDDDISMTISYEENAEAFTNAINEGMSNRVLEFNNYRQIFDKANVDLSAKLDSFDGNMDYSMELYDLGKMIDMLQGEWDFNSYFYDIQNYSTNPKHMLSAIDKGQKNWYIVFVDFHF